MAFGKSKKNRNLPVNVQSGERQARPAPTQRVLPQRSEKTQLPPDRYYMRLTKIMRFSRYFVTFALVIFAIFMAFYFSDEITGEKLKLLLRNASFSFPGEEVHYTTVRYDADLNMDFAAYREYFAVATGSGMRLYDHRGNVALSDDTRFTQPVIDAGEDYILVYDREGKTYILCNSVSHLHTGTEDYPICAAGVADNGSYMLLTSSSMYLCQVKVFNRSFRQTRDIQIDRYPLYAEYAKNGERLLLVSYTTDESGRLETYVSVYDLKDKTKLAFEIVGDELPLGGHLTAEGAAILYGDRFVYYGADGREEKLEYFGSAPKAYAVQDGVFIIDFLENEVLKEHRVLCYDLEKEELIDDFAVKGRLSGMFVSRGIVFLRLDGEVIARSLSSEKQEVIKGQTPLKILTGAEGAIFFCDSSKAENAAALPEIMLLLAGQQTDNADDSRTQEGKDVAE